MTNGPILKKIDPPRRPNGITHKYKPRPKIKIYDHRFFSPLNAPQSGMSQFISTNDHRGDNF